MEATKGGEKARRLGILDVGGSEARMSRRREDVSTKSQKGCHWEEMEGTYSGGGRGENGGYSRHLSIKQQWHQEASPMLKDLSVKQCNSDG